MIKFQYTHFGQWVWNLSESAIDDYRYYRGVLEDTRVSLEDANFIYATLDLNGEFLFMSNIEGGSGNDDAFVGVIGGIDTMTQKPIDYIGKWGKGDIVRTDEGEKLVESMPRAEKSPNTLDGIEKIAPMFAKLAEAILYTNKSIVLLVENIDEAKKYLNAVMSFFPLVYSRRLSFCMGTSGVSDNMSSNSLRDVSVRIFVPTSDKNISMQSDLYWVFDTRNCRNNYNKTLGELGDVIELAIGDKEKLAALSERISLAFDKNGETDNFKLAQLARLFRFDVNPDYETASRTIAAGTGDNDDMQRSAFKAAAQYLLRPDVCAKTTSADRGILINAYRKDRQLLGKNGAFDLFKCVVAKLSEGSTIERDFLVEMAASGINSDIIEDGLFDKSLLPVRKDIFEIACGVLERVNRVSVADIKNFVLGAVRFFDINQCYSYIRNTDEEKDGEIFFDVIRNITDPQRRVLLSAILMASCYVGEKSSPRLSVRAAGLQKLVRNLNMSSRVHIDFIRAIRRKVNEIETVLPMLNVHENERFLCENIADNHGARTSLLAVVVQRLSFNELIDLENELLREKYAGLRRVVETTLLDYSFVESNLRNNPEARQNYRNVYDKMEKLNDYAKIGRLFEALDAEKVTVPMLSEYRWSFVYSGYKTVEKNFNSGNRRKVAEKFAKIFRPTVEEKKTGLVSELFKSVGIAFNWAIWVALPAVVMFFLSSLLAGIFMEGHGSLFNWVLAAVIGVASTFIYWFNHDGMTKIKRNIVTAVEVAILIALVLLVFYGALGLLSVIFNFAR